MDHQLVLELLPAYLDQELSLSETREVERHLDSCEACRQAYALQSDASNQLKQAELRVDAPPALLLSIEAALPRHSAPHVTLGARFRQ